MATVVLIEDDAVLRKAVRKYLSAEGHDVREATDGTEARRLLENEPAELVITDLYMPGMDGIEFIIRLPEQSSKPKIIVISGGGFRDKADLLATAAQLGADRTLEKPFSREQLLEAVAEVLSS